jgi:hypothetical protein
MKLTQRAKLILEAKKEKQVVLYIDFLNAKKNHQKDRKEFKGTWDDAYSAAQKWGRKNIPKFNSDMIMEQN